MRGYDRLKKCILEIAAGNYSDEVLELTKEEWPEEIRELAEAVGMMMVRIEAREFHLEQLNEQLRENAVGAVRTVAAALARRDEYTRGHNERVAEYAVRLARRMGVGESELQHIRTGGLLHDIGKIGFSDTLFHSEDTIPSAEMLEEIRHHPDWGHEILRELEFLGPARDYVRLHHEKLDGSGYPLGLCGEDIPYGARILAVADCFDAITTDRSYQKGRSPQEAVAILRKLAGAHLDPELVEAFAQELEQD